MLIKTDNSDRSTMLDYMYSRRQSKSDEDEEEGELEIDLDYNEYVEVSIKEDDEPLDLSMKTLSKLSNNNAPLNLIRPTLPRLELKPNFQLFNLETKKPLVSSSSPQSSSDPESPADSRSSFMTEHEVTKLLDPYVKIVSKKFLCTVCDMKFANRGKALAHVENKHVDCLQYKCPLCRASKVTRLAYESHLRRGHNTRPEHHSALIKCKKKFCVKSEAQTSGHQVETSEKQYDLQFVTFLRTNLAFPAQPWLHQSQARSDFIDQSQSDKRNALVSWVDQDQGIFRIINKDQFSKEWFAFKVI